VPSQYIPRRNFHRTTRKSSMKMFSLFFLNPFFRDLFYVLSSLLPKKSQIARSINIRLFLYKKASKIKLEKYHVDFNRPLHVIDYSSETRPAIILHPSETIQAEVDTTEVIRINTGLVLLENIFNYNKRVALFDIKILVLIKNIDSSKVIKTLNFPLPVDSKKHGILHGKKGSNWFDFSIDLEDLPKGRVLIDVSCSFTSNTFTMFSRKQINNKVFKNKIPCIALSAPVAVSSSLKQKKNILIISGESLTDPFWLRDVYGSSVKFPNIEALSKDSKRFVRSYSMADSTLPSIYTFLSGLFPSQHGMGDYKKPLYEENPSIDIVDLPTILKKCGFMSQFCVSYPRFDPLYGWGRGVDSYYQAEYPFSSNAPEFSRVVRNFELLKDNNSLMFLHLTRLHGPLLSTDDTQTPQLHKAEDLDSAFNGDFLPLYFSQLEVFDDQIGRIVEYLKNTNQYNNTLILLTGDHGCSLPPKWGASPYAAYEEHLRTPLIIKPASWCNGLEKGVSFSPVSAQKKIFETILKSNNLDLPNFFNYAYNGLKNSYAISETIYHPNVNNYAITLVSKEYKYWLQLEVDWDSCKIVKTLDEKLFLINSHGMVDEENDIKTRNTTVTVGFKEDALKFFHNNSNFRKKYPQMKYPITMSG
jgi:hypothetical protein